MNTAACFTANQSAAARAHGVDQRSRYLWVRRTKQAVRKGKGREKEIRESARETAICAACL